METTKTKPADKPKECGAKSRQGQPCKKPPMKGKNRCANHGAKSTGPRPGNNFLTLHGCYSKALSTDEKTLWTYVKTGSLDDEIRISKIMLLRALCRARDDPDSLLFPAIVDRLLRTVCKLELARAQILGDAGAGDAYEAAKKIRAAIAEMNAATFAAPPSLTTH